MNIATLYTKIFLLVTTWCINICVKLSFCLLGPFPSVPSLYKIHFIQQAKVVELGTSIFEKNTANTLI